MNRDQAHKKYEAEHENKAVSRSYFMKVSILIFIMFHFNPTIHLSHAKVCNLVSKMDLIFFLVRITQKLTLMSLFMDSISSWISVKL